MREKAYNKNQKFDKIRSRGDGSEKLMGTLAKMLNPCRYHVPAKSRYDLHLGYYKVGVNGTHI